MKIVFRADGNSVTGLGHIMRSVAVMQILQSHFQCEFWTRNSEYFPERDFLEMPVVRQLTDSDLLEEAASISGQLSKSTIVVLDGYQFGTAYQKVVKKAGLSVVCIDDLIGYHFVADVVINHAGGIESKAYSREPYTKLYLGPKYALVKPIFHQDRKSPRNLKDKKILVSLGAADPQNDTDRVLEKIISAETFKEINVLIGAANQYFDFLRTKYNSNGSVIFYQGLTGRSVYELMVLCPYAALTPSTICYEYMSIQGVAFLNQIADNQKNIKQYFIQNKMAFNLKDLEDISITDMQYSLKQQAQVFDHKSPERLLKIFTDLEGRAN